MSAAPDPSPRQQLPKVTAVLVAYNRAPKLPRTLDSVLAQSLRDFELIISDDCSTDDTAEICADYARRDPRIRYRRNPRNLGMPGNLNAALLNARGEYLAILHDGDTYRHDLLEKWAAALDRHPKAAFVFNAYAYESVERGGPSGFDRIVMPPCMDGREFLERVFIPNWGGCPVFGTTMLRRSCFESAGPFDPRYSMNSDVEMWMRLASRYDVAYVPEPLIVISPREPDHVLKRHYWWEKTVDVRIKRMALRIVRPKSVWGRLRFELRARWEYAWAILPPLHHRRWREVATGFYLTLTGRDELSPPH